MPKKHTLSALFIPLLGLLMLAVLPSEHIQPMALQTNDMDNPIVRALPSQNSFRIYVLHKQYQEYLMCRQRVQAARTGSDRENWQKSLQLAVEQYNQAADATDLSAFTTSGMPRYLTTEGHS